MNRKKIIISELKINPQDPFNQYLLALEYLNENNRSEAISLFNYIYENSSNYLPVYYIYSLNLIELGNFEMAKIVIKKGIELATFTNKEKVKKELEQLFELYFD
jgi:tetratricopeptide (TPR) repeat protein